MGMLPQINVDGFLHLAPCRHKSLVTTCKCGRLGRSANKGKYQHLDTFSIARDRAKVIRTKEEPWGVRAELLAPHETEQIERERLGFRSLQWDTRHGHHCDLPCKSVLDALLRDARKGKVC